MKKLLSFCLMLLMAGSMFGAVKTVQTTATDDSGNYWMVMVYEEDLLEKTSTTSVYMASIYTSAVEKNMTLPDKVSATFNDYDGNGNDISGMWEYQFFDGYLEFLSMNYTCSMSSDETFETVETLTIPEGITSIPEGFFRGHTDPNTYGTDGETVLKEINLPASLEYIGKEAFAGHANLEKINFGDVVNGKLKAIFEKAFQAAPESPTGMPGEPIIWHSKLTSLQWPDGTEEVDKYAFQGHANLKSITLLTYLHHLGEGIFADCGIETVNLGAMEFVMIEGSPFVGGSDGGLTCPIKKVKLHPIKDVNQIAIVPYRMFENVSSIFDVEIVGAESETFEAVLFGEKCFASSGVKSITFPKKIEDGPTYPGIGFYEGSFSNTFYFQNLDLTQVTDNGSYAVFDVDAFAYSGIKSVNFGSCTAMIRAGAFQASRLDGKLTIPQFHNPVTDKDETIFIENKAFYNTQNLKEVDIQSDIALDDMTPNYLADGIFERCGATSYKLPASLTKIGSSAFKSSKIKSFVGGANIEEIHDGVFAECKDLESVDLSGTKIMELPYYTFSNDSKLTDLKLPAKMNLIREHALEGIGIKEFVSTAKLVERYNLYNMPNLEKVTFANDKTESISEYQMESCPKLKDVDFGPYMTMLNDGIIYDCPSFDSLVISSNIKVIHKDAFQPIHEQIKKIVYKSTALEDIADYVDAPFNGIRAELYFDPSVKSVPKHAFTFLQITNSLELRKDLTFDEKAFYAAVIDSIDWHFPDVTVAPFKDASINKLTFSKIKEIPDGLFADVLLYDIDLKGVETIGKEAFMNCLWVTNEYHNMALVIPASVKEIGDKAFYKTASEHLIFEKGEGLTIGPKAFYRKAGDGAFATVRSFYDAEHIPTADPDAFDIGDAISFFYAGSCSDTEAYKNAIGWKELPISTWDGISEYKISFEMIGEALERPMDYYLNHYAISLNGYSFPQATLGCNNEAELQFFPMCSDMTFLHWNDEAEKDPSSYKLTLTSDTVIRLYVKETEEDLKIGLKDTKHNDAVEFSMSHRNFVTDEEEWTKGQTSGKVSSCNEAEVNVELLDPKHYYFLGWLDKKDAVVSTNETMWCIAGDEYFADVRINQYDITVELDPGCMDCYDKVDELELNGSKDASYLFEMIDYNDEVTVSVKGHDGGSYRYILDYWEDEMGNIVSYDNPYIFNVPDVSLHLRPVMKLADKYDVSVASNDDKLGTVSMSFSSDSEVKKMPKALVTDKTSATLWEKSELFLDAKAKEHCHFVEWNDKAGEESLKASRTIIVKKDFAYVATFAWDKFTVTFTDKDDNTLKTEEVEYGKAATAPADKDIPAVEGYHFSGWDKPFNNITADLTVKAQYEINKYEVTLSAEHGKITFSPSETNLKEVSHGTTLVLTPVADEHYDFIGWWDDATTNPREVKITQDTTLTAKFALHKYKVLFVDKDGNELKSEQVAHGSAATAPDDKDIPAVEGYHFTGWDKKFDNITSDLTVKALYEINKYEVTLTAEHGKISVLPAETNLKEVAHGTTIMLTAVADENYDFTGWSDKETTNPRAITVKENLTLSALFALQHRTVVFLDWDGTELKSEEVEHGSAAPAPKDPTREGYHFTGWDKKFDNITADLTVKAQYEINKYKVELSAEHGSIEVAPKETDLNAVPHGTIIKVTATGEDGYQFVGWSIKEVEGNPVNLTITSDLTLKANFVIKTFSVKFFDKDGNQIGETQTVNWNEAAVAPSNPVWEGHTFTGWSAAFDHVKSDLDIKPIFDVETYAVTFLGFNDVELKKENVEYGKAATAPTAPEVTGYTFKNWDKEFNNITGDLTVKAVYEINKYEVRFLDWDGTELKKEEVEYGKSATAPKDPTREGYTFKGWDLDFSKISGNTIVKAQYEINKYKVVFVDWDDKELKSEEVEHGKSATAPKDPSREGYTFIGWDKKFDNITADLTVKAQYEEVVVVDYTPKNLKAVMVPKDDDVLITLSWDKVEGAISYDLRVSIGEKDLFMRNTMTLNVIATKLSDIEKDYELTPGTFTIDWEVRSTDMFGKAISDWAKGNSFEVTVKDPATGVENVQSDNVQSTKVMINGQIFILRGDKMFDVTGKLVK